MENVCDFICENLDIMLNWIQYHNVKDLHQIYLPFKLKSSLTVVYFLEDR